MPWQETPDNRVKECFPLLKNNKHTENKQILEGNMMYDCMY